MKQPESIATKHAINTVVHPAFSLLEETHISSLNLNIEKYEHKETGALHYHLASENEENVFLVAFRTVPMDSTGVAHILEHTALCGSERYPVRDPFFMMIRRSLNTFMNAMTSSDWTAYPFASKNKKDFNNLLKVYLDSAFFSRIDHLDFLQEGHRLEFEEPNNPKSSLQFKGVVYNEMKGAMSSTSNVLWQTLNKYLYPTTTYHYNSGGEPEHIPDLSYSDLLSFYKSHYHPSNSVIMTFGDTPAIDHQIEFESLALSRFSRLDSDIKVGFEKRYLSPIRAEEFYPSEKDSPNNTHIVIGWLLGSSVQIKDLFKAQLLANVLLDHSGSPLLKKLETTDLGSSPSPICGLDDGNKEMSFMVGLEGCLEEDSLRVEGFILDSLNEFVDQGIPHEQVEAALHQLELNQREISGDSYPYGLQLLMSGLSVALHNGDPAKVLDIDPILMELREAAKNETFIPNLIKELLIENQHRVTLTLRPDPDLATKKVKAEESILSDIKKNLSSDQVKQIVSQAKDLSERQAEQDNPDVLPKVTLEDVPLNISEPTPTESALSKSGIAHTFFGQPTNGLAYQQIVIELPELPNELLEILPLFTSCLPEFGIGQQNYEAVQTWQSRISGGVNCFSSIRSGLSNEQESKSFISLSSKALAKNHSELSNLLYQTIAHVRFDESDRLADLIEQICSRKENSITGQGHSLAMSLASSGFSPTAKLMHEFNGLEGIKRLKFVRKQISEKRFSEGLLDKFNQLHEILVNNPIQLLTITELDKQEEAIHDLDTLWSSNFCNQASDNGFSLPETRSKLAEAWTTSTQVNFCAKAFPTVPFKHKDNATLHVLAGYLRNGFLHRAIRETGGAYGGGASQDSNSASFRFFSYRDPRLEETLDDFDASIDWLNSSTHENYQLEEAILGVVSTLDKPASPAGEAKQVFYNKLFGSGLDIRKAFRDQVLSTTFKDLMEVSDKYLKPTNASTGLITNIDSIQKLKIEDLVVKNI